MTIKTMTNDEIDAALSENSNAVDALKAEARLLTRERGNRAARGKLVASLDSAGNSAEAKAREAEQYAKVDQLVLDQGLIMRAGFPVGLTNNPRVIDAAKVEAAHNREFRRAIPSIRSQEVVGMPTLIQPPPSR
jgi:hypothetical protein